MADLELGTRHGFAVASIGSRLLATVATDGSNAVTVSAADLKNLKVGMTIDIVKISDGTVLASARTIDAINSATNTVTYSGADVTATTAYGIYLTGQYAAGRSNLATGGSPRAGLSYGQLDTIQSMRDRLTAIDSTFYTAARLNTMTENDMVYAIRLTDKAGTIKQ